MYRAYHAIRGLTGPDGGSTNAAYGLVTMPSQDNPTLNALRDTTPGLPAYFNGTDAP